MKKKYIIYIILVVGLVLTFIITPFEINLFKQEPKWMYTLNLKEYLIFAFSFIFGMFIEEKIVKG